MVAGLPGRHLQKTTSICTYIYTIVMKKTITSVNQSGLVPALTSTLQLACKASSLSMQSMRCCC